MSLLWIVGIEMSPYVKTHLRKNWKTL